MGVNSIMNDAGRIGIVIKGDYSNTETYDFLDIAYYNGATYIAKKLTVGNTPDNTEFWHIFADGNIDINDVALTFLQAETRENINSGEKLPVLFGKVKKFFADLKTVAFTGSYTDLSNKPTASDLGLGNVDNTADKDKNVKYAESAGSAIKDSEDRNIAEALNRFANAQGRSQEYTGDLNNLNYNSILNVSGANKNTPVTNIWEWGFVITTVHCNNDSYISQLWVGMTASVIYYRVKVNEIWSSWKDLTLNSQILNTAASIEASTSDDNIVGVKGLKEYLEANYVHK